LTVVAMSLGAVLASGLITEGSWWAQVLGVAVAVLAQLGYTAGRAVTKSAEVRAAAAVEASRVHAEAVKSAGAGDPTKPRLSKE
jgi:hypothetical protein